MLVSVVLTCTSSRVLSRTFCFEGGIFEPRGGEKNSGGFLEGSEGMLPQKILKI